MRLTDLPIEILRCIADQLSKEDTVAYAICNKKLYKNVGRKRQLLGQLVWDDAARSRFLNVYRRDISPFLMSCGSCHFLHRVPQLEKTSWRQFQDRRKCCDVEHNEQSTEYFHSGFGFGCVQVAAELYRRGLAKELFELSYAVSATKRLQSNDLIVFDFAMAVCEGKVYIRKQEWYLLPSTDSVSLPLKYGTWLVCGHIDQKYMKENHKDDIEIAEKALRYQKIEGNLRGAPEVSGKLTIASDQQSAYLPLHQCQFCPTEYRIDLGRLGFVQKKKKQLAIVMTKWMCLGDGQSRTQGSDWRLHLKQPYITFVPTRYIFESLSVFGMFEGKFDVNRYQPRWHKGLTKALEGKKF